MTEDEDAGGGFSFDSIDALTASLHALRGDPLEADGGNIVVYRGSPTARVMVIGEAPGADGACGARGSGEGERPAH